MHFLVALGIVLGPANTPVFVMRCPNVRKLQPRGRGHVVWKHAKNYACASFVLAIEGVGAPSFLRRYAADTVRGWFFFSVSRRVSRLVSGVSRENFNFCRKEKKKISLSKCILVRMFSETNASFEIYNLLEIWEREESSETCADTCEIFGDGMFVIIEISTVLRVFQRIVEYRKLERIIRFGNN